MDYFDPDHPDSNGVGLELLPTPIARSASLKRYVDCGSLFYPQFYNMLQSELANTVEGAGLTLDATDFTQLLQAIQILSGSTGDLKFSMLPPELPWIYFVGSIGDAGSGATQRANEDTFDLFEGFWDNVADSEAPVSGGRGVSALADFNAGKTLTFPEARGHVLRGLDNYGGLGSAGVINVFDGDTNGLSQGNEEETPTGGAGTQEPNLDIGGGANFDGFGLNTFYRGSMTLTMDPLAHITPSLFTNIQIKL